jgi:hypothetical protein
MPRSLPLPTWSVSMPDVVPMTAPRYVFIVGSGRCGSSLLQELLCRHPEVGFMSNLDDLAPAATASGRANRAIYPRIPPALTRKGRVRFAPSEGYRALADEVSPLVCTPGRPLSAADGMPWLARRLRVFFDRRAQAQNGRVFIHKFTGWSRVGLLAAVFPEAAFVHVIRDGRAVAGSLVQMPWWTGAADPALLRQLSPSDVTAWRESGESFPLLAGLEWKAVVESHEDHRRDLPAERWLDLRYEDLITAPQETLGRALEFCGLPWNDAFDRQVERHRFAAPRSTAYRDELGASDLALLERHLGLTLSRYGYALETPAESNPTNTRGVVARP